jgi:outer membrane protein insertion porin family
MQRRHRVRGVICPGCGRALAAAFGVVLGAASAAAQTVGDVIEEVRFEGAERVSESYMLNVVRSRAGAPLDQAIVDQDVVRLLETGRFITATAEVSREDGKAVVTFRVRERPTVVRIAFEGNSEFDDGTLEDKVPLRPGDRIDLYAVREGRENILFFYRSKGYGHARVDVDESAVRNTGEVVYRIEEGPKVRVRKILFEGNTVFDAHELSKTIQTKTAWWIFREGAFDPDIAARDAAAVQQYYRDRGYLDARVSYRTEPGEKPGDLRVVFTIVEGGPYTVESVRIEGNTVIPTDEILRLMTTAPGRIFNQGALDADVRAVHTRYGERGYIYASVRAIRVFSATPGFVVITIRVEEGERMSVGRVVVRGNQHTQDKVVRRALDLYPGDIFNLTKIRNAETLLRQTALFDRATITPVGQEPNVRDIIIDVEESERMSDLLFSFGVTSDAGLVGNIVLNYRNFDIFDTPRSFSEFIKFRSFRGAGQNLRIELQPGTELNRFRIDFTEPYLFDRPLRFDVGLYHFTRDREGYDEQRTGASVSFGKRLEEGLGPRQWFKNWYGEVAFRVENVDLDDVDIFDAKDIREAEGNNFLTSVKGTVVRDRTDNRYIPTSGDRLSFSYEQFVGEWNFGKLRARYARHQTVYTDVEERKSVFSFRVDSGVILGDAPVFERYYAGGIGSIRGFDFRGVGPRGGIEDAPVGGDFLLTTSFEYSFPLAGDVLRGVVFSDMGTVESGIELTKWRVAVGFGVRLTIEIFGPVPIELDIAAPIVSDDDDETRSFSFFIGGSF